MKGLQHLEFSSARCLSQLQELEQLLSSQQEFSERDVLLPFFRARADLSAMIGAYHPEIACFDRIAYEYPLFGDFVADLVVGDSSRGAFALVEFEDATASSVFVKTSRNQPDWSPRFSHGFAQIVDWFWRLSDYENTEGFEDRFESRGVNFMGILVVGRSGLLDARQERRLRWWRKHIVVDSHHVGIFTYDQVLDDIGYRLTMYPEVALRA